MESYQTRTRVNALGVARLNVKLAGLSVKPSGLVAGFVHRLARIIPFFSFVVGAIGPWVEVESRYPALIKSNVIWHEKQQHRNFLVIANSIALQHLIDVFQ